MECIFLNISSFHFPIHYYILDLVLRVIDENDHLFIT